MVRKYKKKSQRRDWKEQDMQLAVRDVLAGKSCKSTAVAYGVPRSTLQNKVKNCEQNGFSDLDNGTFKKCE